MAHLVHALDIEEGEKWQDTWILQHLVDLANVVHGSVEQERLVIVVENGVSVGRGEEDDHSIEEFEAI